jgi:capsular polysaccharide transport system permease protein
MTTQIALLRAFSIQLRVLHALLMREVITRFGRDNLGVLWFIGEPMLFTIGVATLWTLAGMRHSSAIPVVAFAVTGYSSVLMWRNSATRCSSALYANKQLLFHRNVRAIDVFLTRIMLEIAGATSSFIVLASVFMFVGWMPPPEDTLEVIVGWIMLAWFAVALALVIGGGTAASELVERLWHPTAYLLFPLSGAAFMVDWFPVTVQKIVLLLPMVHGVEMLRQGWFGSVVQTHYDLPYMATCCLVLSLAAMYLQWEAGRRVEH